MFEIDKAGLKVVIRNSGWLAAEQIMRLLAGLFVGVWIARHLGPADYGALSFAISFSGLIGIFATLGLSRVVVRELALKSQDQGFQEKLIGSVLALRLIASFFCYWIALLISLWADTRNPLLIAIVSASFAFSSFDVIDQYFQSSSSSRTVVIARSLVFFLFLGVKIILLIAQASVVAFAIAAAIEAATSAGALVSALRASGLRVRRKSISFAYGLGLLRESWPEILAGFACLVFMRIDQIMIGSAMGNESVGIYAVASRLAEFWYFVPSALVASTFPAIVRQREVDRVLYLKRLHQLMLTLALLSYSVVFVVTVVADDVVVLLYGEQYASAASVLVVLAWCGLFVSLGAASGSWIVAERKMTFNLIRNVCGAATSVSLNYVLIPEFGIVGAAYGTLMSLMVAYLFCDFLDSDARVIGKAKLKSMLLIWK